MGDPRVGQMQAALARLADDSGITLTPWQADIIADHFNMHGNVYLARPVGRVTPPRVRRAGRPPVVIFDEIRAWTAEQWRDTKAMHASYRLRQIARRRRA